MTKTPVPLRLSQRANQPYSDEGKFLEDVKGWLEAQQRDGIKVIRICDRYAKGYSDLFICVRGIFVVAELKDDIGTASPHQELFIEEMIRAGAIGGVCRTIKEVADLVDKAKLLADQICIR